MSSLKITYSGPSNEYASVQVQFIPRIGNRELAILDDGSVVLYADLVWLSDKSTLRNTLDRDIDNYLSPLKANEFVRVAKTADDYAHIVAGTHRGSINHRDDIDEGGLSVAKYPEFPTDYMYYVTGEVIGQGTDGEPLLDLSTVKVSSRLMSHKQFSRNFKKRYDANIKKMGLTSEDVRALKSGSRLVF